MAVIWIFNPDDDYFIGQFPVRNDFPGIQGPGLGPLILTPQAAVAGLGDELFLEPLGAGMGEFQLGVTSGFEWLDPDTAGFIYTVVKGSMAIATPKFGFGYGTMINQYMGVASHLLSGWYRYN